jgi:hypothetical protein
MKPTPEVVIAVVVIAAFIFVPFLRRFLGLIIRLAMFAIGVTIAAAAISMIGNNETIFGASNSSTKALTNHKAGCDGPRSRKRECRDA